MSCRTTSGGSVSTSLARSYTGLSDGEIQRIFHALKREGAETAPPSEVEIDAWRNRQYDLIDRARQMPESRKDSLRDKLFRSRSEPTPDGGTFYAWSRIEARARQDVVLRGIDAAIDLAPPGSQRHLYEIDAEGKPARIWYASYGSNLHRDRFLVYIKGGRPEGSRRFYDGCRDQTIPENDIPIRYAGARPHFALTSSVWNGGIAFIDANKGETATGLGRAYAVTREQFEDVVAQENGLRAGQCSDIPYADVLDTGRVVTGPGPYETLLHIGDYEGAPVFTFTAPFSTRDALGRKGQVSRSGVRMSVMTNKPSAAYVRMIGSGLAETFDMDEVAQADYLRGCPGGDRWTRRELVETLRAPAAPEPTYTSSWSRYGTGATSGYHRAGQQRWGSGYNYGGSTYSGSQNEPSADSGVGSDPGYVVTKHATDPNTQAGNQTGNQTGSKTPQRTATPTTDPTARGIFPRVKQYQSKEEQQAGVARWQAHLRKAEDEINWRKAGLVGFKAYRDETPAQAQARRARLQRNFDEVSAEAAELAAKVAYAKSQTPERYYSSEGRTRASWEGVRRMLWIEIDREEHRRKHAAHLLATASQNEGSKAPKAHAKWLRKVKGSHTRAANKIIQLQARLDEIEKHHLAD